MKWETEIFNIIQDKAENIPEIQEVHMHPLGFDALELKDGKPVRSGTRAHAYPALVFAKDSFDQEFSDTGSNFLTLNFLAWIVVGAENVNMNDLFARILPNATDAVLNAFNKGWDFGTINNHRVWCKMASGTQGYTAESKGREAWCEMRLTVKLSVDV